MSVAVGVAVGCSTTAPCNPAQPGNEVYAPQIHAYVDSTVPALDGGTPVQVTVRAEQAGCLAPATNPSAHLSTSRGTFAGTATEVTVELKPMGDGAYIGSTELRILDRGTARVDLTVGQVKACRFLSLADAGGSASIVEQDCAP